jgi:hypothetical protein
MVYRVEWGTPERVSYTVMYFIIKHLSVGCDEGKFLIFSSVQFVRFNSVLRIGRSGPLALPARSHPINFYVSAHMKLLAYTDKTNAR